jgi:hypothetical protein
MTSLHLIDILILNPAPFFSMNNILNTSAKKGFVTALFMVIASLLCFYWFHLPENGNSQYLILLIYTLGMLWVMDSARKKIVTGKFGSYFQEGFRGFIVCTLIMVIYTYFFYRFNPDILEAGIRINNQLILAEGNKTPAEIQANSEKIRDLFMPMMISLNTIKFLFLGAMISTLLAVFFSQKASK